MIKPTEPKPIYPWIATSTPDFCYDRKSPFCKLQEALKHVINDPDDKEEIQHRNKRCYELLTDLKPLYPAIEEALEDEKTNIFKWIDNATKELVNSFKSPATITLDEWWYYLLDKPKGIFTYVGALEVIKRNYDHGSYDPGTGDTVYYNATWVSVEDLEYAAAEKKRLEQYK